MLKWHYFSVMSNDGAGLDNSGAVDRKGGYSLIHLNLQGHLQATLVSSSKGRNDLIEQYNLQELETYYTIYHKYPPETYEFSPATRILIHKNPRKQLTASQIFGDDSLVRTYDFIGTREPVALRSRLEFYEMYLKEVHRWSI